MLLGLKSVVEHFRDVAWDVSVRIAMRGESGADTYEAYVRAANRLLGVPPDYSDRGIPFQRQCSNLVDLPCGVNGGYKLVDAGICQRFLSMKEAALEEGVTLSVKWAFRSVEDQARLIRAQLRYGASMAEILSRVAAPGYSEHHSGRAFDFERIPSETLFERTEAFKWLVENAWRFDCVMSYPPNNGYGVIYEPWHWYFR